MPNATTSNIFKAIDLNAIIAFAVTPQMQDGSGIGFCYQLNVMDTDGKILDAIVWDSFEVEYTSEDNVPENNQRFVVRNDGLMLSTISLLELLPLVDTLTAKIHDMSGTGVQTIEIEGPEISTPDDADVMPAFIIAAGTSEDENP